MSETSGAAGLALQPRFSHGFLACLPLLLAYEAGLALGGPEAARNGAEVVLLPLAPLGGWLWPARLLAVGLVALLLVRRLRREEDELDLPRLVLRSAAEGAVLALLFGPLLLWMLRFFDLATSPAELLPAGRLDAPDLARALRLAGGAPWEELLFRVLVFGALHLVAWRAAEFLGLGRVLALAAAEVVALLGSSAAFAAFHLAEVQALLGRAGEPFDPASFLWRLLAGLVLAGLYRWRGLGTAAWTHGVFNLALALGAGPGVSPGA